MASTHGGMRRILKKRLPVQKYIELAVKSGSYKSPSTRPNYLGLHDQRDNNNNSFQTRREREESLKMRRGIIDYPTEHEILSMNPPLPDPPRTPVRIRKKLLADKRRRAEKLKKEQKRKGISAEMMEEQKDPPSLDKLVKGYLRRHEDKLRQGMSPSQSRKEEEYYSQLLLGQSAAASSSGGSSASKSKSSSPSSLRTAMGRKSMLVENAYAFALRQQQVMLQEDEPASEQDSIEKVEEILREEAKTNRQSGRKATQEIEEWRTEQSSDDATTGAEKEKKDDDDESTVPSILHDRPRSIRALNIWSSRLQSIPYSRWTIGAATALDHWIAREVLQMDENTWQLVLAGGGTDAYVEGMETLPGGESKMGLMDRMRDIVTVRGALFPETLTDSESSGARGVITGELDDELSETDKSIDELLASLGSSVDDDDADLFKFDDDEDEDVGDDANDNDEQIESIMDELQVWRERNESSPYESWDNDRKSEFDQWLEKYVAILSPEADGSSIDKDATRIALLSERPIDSNKSKEFWSKVHTETEAELFLEDYRKHAEERLQSLNDASSQTDEETQTVAELQAILSVPFERQLQKILDMGTLRPVLDDYARGTERNAFLDKYTPIFLEGLVMEHLVPDADGPIGLDDLSSEIRDELSRQWLPGDGMGSGSDQEPRFAIQMIAYGTDEFATSRAERARDLYRLWNEHKAGRARFEEALFKKGFLPVEEDGTRGRRKNVKKTPEK